MKITKENIDKFVAAAEAYFKSLGDDGGHIEDDVLTMGAGDEVVCLLTPDELVGNRTSCGSSGNVCFDNEVAAFLKSKGVERVIVGVYQDEFSEGENMVINGGAVPIPFGDDSEALSDMIRDRGGSWRDDDCRVDGWSTYESE